MMHGPCGPDNPTASCMKDGKCTKGFPKIFQQDTVQCEDGYPLYKRREFIDGVKRTVNVTRNGTVYQLDNGYVRLQCQIFWAQTVLSTVILL